MSGIEMEHAGTKALHAFWSALRAGRAAPYRAEVTAAGLGRALSEQVFMLEALAPGDYRIRLSGGALFDIFGMDLRGMRPEALMEVESRPGFLALADAALASDAVAIAHAAAGSLTVEFVLAPLRSDFGRADRLLGAVHVIGPTEVAPAARRFRLLRAGLIGARDPAAAPAAPLPGFAESATPFGDDRPALKGVAGGGAGRGERRRDHLKIVKD